MWKKLVDKLEQIEPEEAIVKNKSPKNMTCLTPRTLPNGLPSMMLALGSQEAETEKNHEQRHCKWCKQKDGSIWTHNAGEYTYYNKDLTPV